MVDLGTVFVASAGNSGNRRAGGSAYIVGTPDRARRGVVAASIDAFSAQTITINSPRSPCPSGIMVHQTGYEPPAGGLTDDLFDGRELDPRNPGQTPATRSSATRSRADR